MQTLTDMVPVRHEYCSTFFFYMTARFYLFTCFQKRLNKELRRVQIIAYHRLFISEISFLWAWFFTNYYRLLFIFLIISYFPIPLTSLYFIIVFITNLKNIFFAKPFFRIHVHNLYLIPITFNCSDSSCYISRW